ncbi:hypothetical protein FEF34_04880 [Streptomyces marianii]|uniref:UvrD-like helicase C-terminal domain-containing protein n=1 Tax=Streptomyces marianii TaxID=1817406 RepID=A0A5R9DYB9_9ACTN|nr:hypothetical protein FEF34_04880 [Streptomyces marianii]
MDKELEAFIRARNLFYVACSRAREHLAILFTTKLEPAALDTLREWVGESRITSPGLRQVPRMSGWLTIRAGRSG